LASLTFTNVFSSPMQRALRTAQIAGFALPVITPLLSEVDYGEYEGLTTADIHARRPGWELFHDGCPGGETPAQMYDRALRFLQLAAQTSGTVLTFAHGHILRAIGAAWAELDITAAAHLRLDVATLSLLADSGRGHELALWNAP